MRGGRVYTAPGGSAGSPMVGQGRGSLLAQDMSTIPGSDNSMCASPRNHPTKLLFHHLFWHNFINIIYS